MKSMRWPGNRTPTDFALGCGSCVDRFTLIPPSTWMSSRDSFSKPNLKPAKELDMQVRGNDKANHCKARIPCVDHSHPIWLFWINHEPWLTVASLYTVQGSRWNSHGAIKLTHAVDENGIRNWLKQQYQHRIEACWQRWDFHTSFPNDPARMYH